MIVAVWVPDIVTTVAVWVPDAETVVADCVVPAVLIFVVVFVTDIEQLFVLSVALMSETTSTSGPAPA
jgi:hypothetical protein